MILVTIIIGDVHLMMTRLSARLYRLALTVLCKAFLLGRQAVGLKQLIKPVHQTVEIIYLIKMTCMPMMHKALINNILEHDQH